MVAKKSKTGSSIFKRILLWSPANKNRMPRYVVLGVVSISLIWTLCLGYLKFAKPKYTSHWTLVLPGKGAGANVNLVDIGHTSTMSASPYSNASNSPKANYKEFAMSSVVRKNAAKKMNMSIDEFGKSRVKLVDQTSLIYFSIEGNSAKQAQEKAEALHSSLLELLDKLRQDEISQQEISALSALEGFRAKLARASQNLLNFQSESKLVSMTQFNEIVMSIEKLRREKSSSAALLNEIEGKAMQLSHNLGVTAKQASDSLVLQNDQLFQEIIKDNASIQLEYYNNLSKWGENHPTVKNSVVQYEMSNENLNSRFSQLIKKTVLDREILELKGDATRNKLLQDLIDFDVAQHGLRHKISTQTKLISNLIEERNSLTIPASKLDELIRNHQVAEAIFTSALARTDTSKSDVYVSYPLVQVLDSPSLPIKTSSPNRIFALLGATVSSVFTILGLTLLWIRKPYIRRILKSA